MVSRDVRTKCTCTCSALHKHDFVAFSLCEKILDLHELRCHVSRGKNINNTIYKYQLSLRKPRSFSHGRRVGLTARRSKTNPGQTNKLRWPQDLSQIVFIFSPSPCSSPSLIPPSTSSIQNLLRFILLQSVIVRDDKFSQRKRDLVIEIRFILWLFF